MHRTAILLAISVVWVSSTPASAQTAQALKACVQKKLAQVPGCIRTNGRGSADPCRTGIAMELQVECTEKLDPQKRYEKDPVRRKILFDACVTLFNPGTGPSAREECEKSYPPIGK
jgi:hypothetical protein